MTSLATTSQDVIVVGGGPAGVTAAVAARLAGANRVMLIEKAIRLGGAVTWALHRAICGLYASGPAYPADTLNAGLQRQIISHMAKLAPDQVIPKRMGKAWVLEFPQHAWQEALDHLCNQTGVTLAFSASIKAVKRDHRHLTAVQLHDERTSQNRWIDAGVVIDATGTGRVLKLAGPDTHQPEDDLDQQMMGGYAIALAGLSGDAADLASLRLLIPYTLAAAVGQGRLPAIAKLTVFHPGPGPDQGVCKMAVDPEDLLNTSLVQERTQAVTAVLRETIPNCRDMTVMSESPFVLARQGLRLQGKAVLTRAAVIEGETYHETGTTRAWWPIERWDDAHGPSYTFAPEGRPYEITGAMLQCAAVGNLLAAGMNISADAQAAASLRASGVCLALGEQAGRLAVTGGRK